MAPSITRSVPDHHARTARLSACAGRLALAVTIEVALALLHLPSAVCVHAGLAIALHAAAEMLS